MKFSFNMLFLLGTYLLIPTWYLVTNNFKRSQDLRRSRGWTRSFSDESACFSLREVPGSEGMLIFLLSDWFECRIMNFHHFTEEKVRKEKYTSSSEFVLFLNSFFAFWFHFFWTIYHESFSWPYCNQLKIWIPKQ